MDKRHQEKPENWSLKKRGETDGHHAFRLAHQADFTTRGKLKRFVSASVKAAYEGCLAMSSFEVQGVKFTD